MFATKLNCRVVSLFFILCLIAVSLSCAGKSAVLKYKPVDLGAYLKGPASNDAFNVIRFRTFGPNFLEQLYGYFLYPDRVIVHQAEGIPFQDIGKMTMPQVLQDYRQVQKTHLHITGSNLIVHAYYLEEDIVGYYAADIDMEVTVWSIGMEEGKPVLLVVYQDLRQKRGLPLAFPRH